jgi:hypothetical protein
VVEQSRDIATKIIWIQRIDTTYDSVDFGDPTSTVSYFKKLYQAVSRFSEEDVDRTLNILMARTIDKETKDADGSIKSSEAKALSIMKSTAEKIHGDFQKMGRVENQSLLDILRTLRVKFVISAVIEAMESLLELVSPELLESQRSLPVGNKKGSSAFYTFISLVKIQDIFYVISSESIRPTIIHG